MSKIRLVQVDAFTDRPFAGNPAAVCLLDEPKDSDWMQAVATEMNLSETAFLLRIEDGYDLRWFTPAIEVDLCGHATLAAAHVLWTEAGCGDKTIRFHTRSDLLTASRQGDFIELDFPATPATPSQPPEGMLEALGVRPSFVGRSKFDKFMVVDSEQAVRSLEPDFHQLGKITGIRGVIVTGPSDDGSFDFVSRYFAPGAGIDEDPVTGSAHCCLGPYWSQRLGKSELMAYQASARGGIVRVRIHDDRVLLGGQAVTVMKGTLL